MQRKLPSPGAMEEILTGHIKATDAEITALAQTPKEEIPAIIKELRKPKKDRKAKKPTSPEKSDVAADDAPDSDEVHTESEITPVSNSPPGFQKEYPRSQTLSYRRRSKTTSAIH